jgi:hypothetical protein
MQNSKFTNMRFKQLVEGIREVMPVLAVTLLIAVYAISGAVAGKFLGSPTLLGKLDHGVFMGYAVGFAIQATRALLVFFRQLNPVRPTLSHTGEWIAAGMGIISIYEIYNLSAASGMGNAVAFSLGVLMLAGIGIEIFLLSELRFHTEMELYQDKEYWAQIESYYQAKSDFRARMQALRNGERITPPVAQKAITTPKNADMGDPGIPFQVQPKLILNGNGKH